MIRALLIVAFAFTAASLLLPAQGNPLAQIKEAANKSRDAAEEHSENVAEEAERVAGQRDPDHDDQAGHDDHAEHTQPAAQEVRDDQDSDHAMRVTRAVAVMLPTPGNGARGLVVFTQTEAGVTVTADVSGLTPNQPHGFHIHEYGDISDPAGNATGGRYHPKDLAGGLGNLQADAEGNAFYQKTFTNFSIAGSQHPVLGRGVIIHAQPDDGDPATGKAGARIAQGVIGVAK